MARQSQYTLLIICEGENTEPHFFNTIRDRILQGCYPMGHISITIHPEPKVKEKSKKEEDGQKQQKEYVRQRKSRALLNGKPLPPEISGVPPLKWVLAAQDQLREGTYNEVWVVFDKDEHPAVEEAFAAAAQDIDGKQVQVAYTSITFEYYLLLHFERYYFQFDKSECRIGDNVLNCSTTNADPRECAGKRCVGGYARLKQYWTHSKDRTSLFPLIEPLLETGFWNSAWIRYESKHREADVPIHERNPFLTTDRIVKRLTGKAEHIYEFVQLGQEFTIDGRLIIVFDADLSVKVTNIGKVGIILPVNSISVTLLSTGVTHTKGQRMIIPAGDEVSVPFAASVDELSQAFFIFTVDKVQLALKS